MLERSISEEDVQASIDVPLDTVEIRFGRMAVCARSAERYVLVGWRR